MLAHLSSGNERPFDPERFLSNSGAGKELLSFRKRQTIFAQGDPADAVFYIRDGQVRMRVVAKNGKEATIAILEEGDYFGEACLMRLTSSDMFRQRTQRLLAGANCQGDHARGVTPGM